MQLHRTAQQNWGAWDHFWLLASYLLWHSPWQWNVWCYNWKWNAGMIKARQYAPDYWQLCVYVSSVRTVYIIWIVSSNTNCNWWTLRYIFFDIYHGGLLNVDWGSKVNWFDLGLRTYFWSQTDYFFIFWWLFCMCILEFSFAVRTVGLAQVKYDQFYWLYIVSFVFKIKLMHHSSMIWLYYYF